ncbi:MAG: hypothetical protein AAB401_21865, partial [Acidobacteriota bacterium]
MEYAFPRIIFPDDFDERAAFEVSMKGWLMAQVELENGSRYPVCFYDPVRLQQDFESEVGWRTRQVDNVQL